jgi:hypothetical protein
LDAPHDWSKFLLFLLRCMSLFMAPTGPTEPI